MADDFLKSIEQARTIMKLLNPGPSAGEPRPGPPPQAPVAAAASEPAANAVPDADLKVLSATIPFLPHKNRKTMFMALKVFEILRFNERYGGSVTIAENEEKPFRPEEFVAAVSPYIASGDRDRLNILIKAAEIDKLMNALKESGNNGQKNTR